jgi:hypothetical protein
MIDRQLASFLEQGVGIHLAARDAQLAPHGARAAALKVDEDGAHLTVYVAEIAAARLLGHLEANRQASINVGCPLDDRACQIKGVFVSSRPASADERDLVDAQWASYVDQLSRIGIARAALGAWVTWPAVAVRIKATALFEQTPGPLAGNQLA